MEIKGRTVSAVLLGLAIAIGFYFRDSFTLKLLEQSVRNAGVIGVLLFIGIYAIGTILFFPGLLITMAGGALYGPYIGTGINMIGAILGAVSSFFIARYLASSWIEKKSGPRLKALQAGIDKEGWRFIALVRLVPLFPFNLLNYALGLTRIHPFSYAFYSFIFMIPGCFAYTWIGYLGSEAAHGEKGLIDKILIGISLLTLLFLLPRIIGHFRRGKTITVEELRILLSKKQIDLLLDVRSEQEFLLDPGHISGAVNIPDTILKESTEKIANFMEKKIAVICRTDKRSAAIAFLLAKQGYGDVHIVSGGIMAWVAQGLPIKRKK